MPPTTRTPERYATEVGELWSGLTRTLSRLEALAEAPDRLDEGNLVSTLRRLQYALHSAGEHAFGIAPPPGAERAHAELAATLVGARDATAEIAEAIDELGLDAAQRLVHQWRGALFRVRLARLRLARGAPAPLSVPQEASLPGVATALAKVVLCLGGSVVFVLGAMLELWPLWVAGLTAVAASLVIYKPYP